MKILFGGRLLAQRTLAMAPILLLFQSVDAQQLEEIVVVAQKRIESVQDVPIAIAAFDADAIDRQQLKGFSDLQFTTPSVSFSRGNFSTSNFQIRGVGSAEVAASGDPGVGFHINGAYLNTPRITDTEFYDLERIEVLRGPQGTLYGRNSTGGAINLLTAKPDLDETGGDVDLQYGNYDHMRARGSINLPIGGGAALRVAGLWLQQDGYTENINTAAGFDNVDGRDLWSGRASLRWQPRDTTTIDLLYQRFDEDDTRTRGNKQLCTYDASAVLGCLPTGLATQTTNLDSSLGRLFVSNLVMPNGLNLTQFGASAPENNPEDLRKVHVNFKPSYRAEEDFYGLEVRHDLSASLTVNFLANHQKTAMASQQSFTNAVGETISVPAALAAELPATYAEYYSNGCFPTSALDPYGTGTVGGFIDGCSNEIRHVDRSDDAAEQTGLELRLASTFDGRFNFLLAANYLDYDRSQNYYVVNNTVDYFSLVFVGAGLAGGPGASPGDGLALLTPFFRIQTDRYDLETTALFGEVYFDFTPDLKLTVGARYTEDEKNVRDRQYPLFTGGVVPFDGFDPTTADSVWLAAGFDADPATSGQQLFRESTLKDNAVTGRVVLDYAPELSFTDKTLFYASYSRGYRAGGFNPAFDPAAFPGTPPTYRPEFIDAFEVGTKNRLLDGRLQANLTGFYYDYQDLQVVKTVNRALINENIDAEVWGIEGELIAAPTDHWTFNLNFSHLSTDITRGASVDTHDPTNRQLNSTLIKSLANTENCVINWNGNSPDPMTSPPAFLIASPGGPTAGIASGSAALSAVGCGDNLQTSLDAFAGAGAYTVDDGNEADLTGRSLQNAPEWSFSLGAQYSQNVAETLRLETRVDYYWQSDMWARIFNRPATDRIESWDMLNAQVTLYGRDDRWYVRGYVTNLLDDDNVTGYYLNAPSSGLFTNVFLLDPRTFGVMLGLKF